MFSKRKFKQLTKTISDKSKDRTDILKDIAMLNLNFQQISNLISKLQVHIDTTINSAVNEIAKGKNIQKNCALITQNRTYEANLKKMVPYINPTTQLFNLLASAFKALLILDTSNKLEIDESQSTAIQQVLAGNIEMRDKAIPDSDLQTLLLNGKFLPLFDALTDLYQFTLDATLNSLKMLLDTSPIVLDKDKSRQNIVELINVANKIEARAKEKGIDLKANEIGEKILGLKEFMVETIADDEEFSKFISEMSEDTDDDAKIIKIALNAPVPTLIKKLFALLQEADNLKKLIDPLVKPISELKREVTLTAIEKSESKNDVHELKAESKPEAKTTSANVAMFSKKSASKPAKSEGVLEKLSQNFQELRQKLM